MIGWVGSLKEVKRPECFLELVQRCKDLPVSFEMSGQVLSEKYEPMIEKVRQEVPNLHWNNFVPYDQIGSKFARMHLLASTSLSEGGPNVFMQAWIRGIPVISLGADPDGLLSREKLGAHVNSVAEMERVVRDILSKPDQLQALGRKVREFALKEFDLERNTNRLEALMSSGGVRLPFVG